MAGRVWESGKILLWGLKNGLHIFCTLPRCGHDPVLFKRKSNRICMFIVQVISGLYSMPWCGPVLFLCCPWSSQTTGFDPGSLFSRPLGSMPCIVLQNPAGLPPHLGTLAWVKTLEHLIAWKGTKIESRNSGRNYESSWVYSVRPTIY